MKSEPSSGTKVPTPMPSTLVQAPSRTAASRATQPPGITRAALRVLCPLRSLSMRIGKSHQRIPTAAAGDIPLRRSFNHLNTGDQSIKAAAKLTLAVVLGDSKS